MTMTKPMLPDEIAEAAERIYDARFREKYEGSHDDEFLAIDVINESAYHGKHPEDALEKAQEAAPDGTFYLIKIGAPATFNVGYIGEQQAELEGSLRLQSHRSTELQPA